MNEEEPHLGDEERTNGGQRRGEKSEASTDWIVPCESACCSRVRLTLLVEQQLSLRAVDELDRVRRCCGRRRCTRLRRRPRRLRESTILTGVEGPEEARRGGGHRGESTDTDRWRRRDRKTERDREASTQAGAVTSVRRRPEQPATDAPARSAHTRSFSHAVYSHVCIYLCADVVRLVSHCSWRVACVLLAGLSAAARRAAPLANPLRPASACPHPHMHQTRRSRQPRPLQQPRSKAGRSGSRLLHG